MKSKMRIQLTTRLSPPFPSQKMVLQTFMKHYGFEARYNKNTVNILSRARMWYTFRK